MLVLLYQQHPCLYVQRSEDYHNRDKRLKALQTIAQQLHDLCGCVITIDVIKKKIARLRGSCSGNRTRMRSIKQILVL